MLQLIILAKWRFGRSVSCSKIATLLLICFGGVTFIGLLVVCISERRLEFPSPKNIPIFFFVWAGFLEPINWKKHLRKDFWWLWGELMCSTSHPSNFPSRRIFYHGFLFVGQIKAPLGDADKEKAQECNAPDRHGNVANAFTTTHRSLIMPLGQNGGL